MSEALAHVSFAGIALALLFGFQLNVTVLIFVVAVAVLIGFISQRNHLDEANTTTIFLAVSMALAIILLRLNKSYTVDLAGYLFGNILLVTSGDIITLGIILCLNLLFLVLFLKELFYMTYNPEIAAVFKIPVTLVYYLFLIFLAVNIVVTVKITGIVLITAQLILPGITALNLARSIRRAIVLSVLVSVLASFAGFLVSYFLAIPSGATIVLLLFLLFLLSLLYRNLIFRQKQPH